ncbi:MAG: ComEC/Rec2 family competence protein [Alphaproteobacteria bacterium]
MGLIFFAIGGLSAHLNSGNWNSIEKSGVYEYSFAKIIQVEPINAKKHRIIAQISPNNTIQVTSLYEPVDICSLSHMRVFLNKPLKELTPHGFSLYRYAKNKNISAYGWLVSQPQATGQKQPNFTCYVNQARQKIYTRLQKHFSNESIGLASTLLLGYKASLTHNIQRQFNHFGLGHILTISGLHIGLLSVFFFGLFRTFLAFFGRICLYYNTKSIAAILCIPIIIFYAIIAGMQAATLRATIMVVYGFIAIILSRRVLSFRVYSFALMSILILWPSQIYTSGFQLSFLAVLGLIIFAKIRPFKRRWLQNIATTVFIILWLAPITLYYFGFISFIGIIANILILPILSFVILPSLFLGVVFTPLWHISDFCLQILLRLSHMDIGSSLIFSSVQPSLFSVIAFYITLTILLILPILLQRKNTYIFSLLAISALTLTFMGYMNKTEQSVTSELLIYEGPIWVWKQEHKLHIRSLNPKMHLSPYLLKQVKKYFGVTSDASIDFSYGNSLKLHGKRIVYTDYYTNLSILCSNYDIVIAPYQTRCKNKQSFYLQSPYRYNFYHFSQLNDKDKIHLHYFAP